MIRNFQFIKSIVKSSPLPIMAVSIDNLDLLFSSGLIEKVLVSKL